MRRLVASVLIVAAAVAARAQNDPLKIVVIEGEGAVNLLQRKTAIAPVVEVRDRNNLPVSGAAVTFSLAGSKTAVFATSSDTLQITTNAAGRAAVPVLTPIASGPVEIKVSATFEGHTATAVITQTNAATSAQAAEAGGVTTPVPLSGGRSKAKVATIAGVAGGAAAGALALAVGSGDAAVLKPALSITTDPGTITGIRDVTQFSFSAEGGNILIPAYGWDFGDGFTASGRTVSRTFTGDGTYTVTVRAIGAGQTEIANVSIRIASLTGTWVQQIANATLRLVITQQGRTLGGQFIVQGNAGFPSSTSPLTGAIAAPRTVTISQTGECARTMTLTANADLSVLTGAATAAAPGCEAANGTATLTRQ